MLAFTAWVGRSQDNKNLILGVENEQNFGAVQGAKGRGVHGGDRGAGEMTKGSLSPGLITLHFTLLVPIRIT